MLDLGNYRLKDTIMYAESRKLGTSIYASKEYNESGDYEYLCLTFSLHNIKNFDDEYDNVSILELKNTFNNETELRRCMEKHFKMFNENRKLQKLVEDFYEYTTTISITEWEYFCNLEYIEEKIQHRETTREDYIKESYKEILYDMIFNISGIEEQIINDLDVYEEDSGEYEYIKEMYNELKEHLNIYVEELEREE